MCVCVCVCVYLSVPALAASASVEDSKQRYSRVSLRLFLDFDSLIFEKPKVIARKSSRFAHFQDQRTAGTTTGRSNIASDASYYRMRRVTSEIAASKNSSVLCICRKYGNTKFKVQSSLSGPLGNWLWHRDALT